MTGRIYTVLCPFSGLGGGALGFQQAEVRLFETTARFRCIGGIDFDPLACEDFEALTGCRALQADIGTMTVDELLAFAGRDAPDVVFLSPPCKGASGLLSDAKAKTAKYRAMNALALRWTKLMLDAWKEPPRLLLLENVPRLKKRAARMLRAVRALLHRAGYVFSDGFHDCGEIGGLGAHRKRYLLVARHAKRVPPLLYQPPKKRVRGCGEVLSRLPMPTTPEAGQWGRLHELPRLSWLNWVRLALIPAGGDWRDLPGVLAKMEARREKFRRHHVESWEEPSIPVVGSGSNGPSGVADPRGPDWYRGTLGVLPFDQPAGAITGNARPSTGAFSVADPRVVPQGGNENMHWGKYDVRSWEEPAGTVTGSGRVGSGAPSVADPRVKVAFDHGYGVLRWDEPSSTIAGGSHPGQSAYSVADIRVADIPLNSTPRAGAYGVISLDEAAKTITGAASVDNGAWAVADSRIPEAPPVILVRDIRKAPSAVPVILAEDGTWHRPITILEKALLQDLPERMPDGRPLTLAGASLSACQERIGNAVPRSAAKAIAERMLVALVEADLHAFSLKNDGAVWIAPEERT